MKRFVLSAFVCALVICSGNFVMAQGPTPAQIASKQAAESAMIAAMMPRSATENAANSCEAAKNSAEVSRQLAINQGKSQFIIDAGDAKVALGNGKWLNAENKSLTAEIYYMGGESSFNAGLLQWGLGNYALAKNHFDASVPDFDLAKIKYSDIPVVYNLGTVYYDEASDIFDNWEDT